MIKIYGLVSGYGSVQILNGANIVRVHDVKENKRAITVTENILAAK